MRYILPMLAVASLTALAGPANSQGQNSRGCADYSRDSSTNCGFVTYEHAERQSPASIRARVIATLSSRATNLATESSARRPDSPAF